MSVATTHAVLAELVASGWAHRDRGSRSYRLGSELLAWAAPLVRADTRIRSAVHALAAGTGLPVLFGQVRDVPGRGPSIVVEDTSVFESGRGLGLPSIELPFAAPFGSVIAAHAQDELRRAWLPRDAGLSELFAEQLASVATRGYSVESYGPHIAQLLSMLRSSAADLGRDRAERLTEDLQRMIASGDHALAAKYPALLSVPIALPVGPPGSLTVQMRHTDQDPLTYLGALRAAAQALSHELAEG